MSKRKKVEKRGYKCRYECTFRGTIYIEAESEDEAQMMADQIERVDDCFLLSAEIVDWGAIGEVEEVD